MADMDKGALLDLLFGDVVERVKADANKKLEEIAGRIEKRSSDIEEKAKGSLDKLDALLNNKPLVVNFGSVEAPKNAITHKIFPTIIKILESSKRKDKNIMLVGGAGGGKTHLVKQIAEALKLDFCPMSVGLQTTKSDLLGFINATGNYVTSPIRQAYENGGVLLLDEFDAAHAGVVTILNSLLANGHASFPDKIVSKNEKFICICACNTYGRGASVEYVGRNRLDGATLDRFIVVNMDYDEQLEKALTNNDSWIDAIVKIRENIAKQSIKMIVSPRASIDGADLLEAGFSAREVLDMVVFKGCDKDVEKKMLEGVDIRKIRNKQPKSKDEASKSEVKQKDSPSDSVAPEEIYGRLDLDFDKWDYTCDFPCKTNFSSPKNGLNSFDIYVGEDGEFSTYLATGVLFVNIGSHSFDATCGSDEIKEFIYQFETKTKSEFKEKIIVNITYQGIKHEFILGGD